MVGRTHRSRSTRLVLVAGALLSACQEQTGVRSPPRVELGASALRVGDSTRARVIAPGAPADALALRSTDPAVAEVRAGGWIVARGVGRAEIVAGAAGAGDAAAVTVSAAALDCQFAGSIGLNQSVTGSLTTADCRLSDGSYADAYSLTVSGTASVQIDLTSAQFDAYLILADASGSRLASDDDSGGSRNARIRRTLTAGTYTIWANSALGAEFGSYRLSVVRNDGGSSGGSSGGSCSYAGSIAVNQAVTGTLSSSDCRLSDGSYADAYSFTVGSASAVQIDLASTAFDAYLILTDASGTQLATDDDSGDGTNAQIRRTLSAGTYTIWANAIGAGTGGSYRLTVTATGGSSGGSSGGGSSGGSSGGCSTSGAVGLNQAVTGALSSSDCRLSDGSFADAYTLTLSSAAGVQIDLSSSAFDAYLIITDASGNVVASDDDSGANLDSQIRRTLGAGTYYLWVTSVGSPTTGSYRLSVARTDGGSTGGNGGGQASAGSGSCTYAGSLGVNQSITGALASSDCRLSGGAYADGYVLTVGSTTTVQIDLTSGAFDAYLVLFDGNGNILEDDDDSGGSFNARIRRTLGPGTYYVWALSVGSVTTGSYRLTVAATSGSGSTGGTGTVPGGTRPCNATGSLGVNQGLSGSLGAGDCLLADGSYTDAYLLTLGGAESLQIDVTSQSFDAIVIVTNELGDVLWIDDDGGSGTNARVRTKLPAGRYWIWVGSYGIRSAGVYSLIVARR